MGVSARRELLTVPVVLQPGSTTSDPVRNGIAIAALGALFGWFARSLLLSSFKQAVVTALKDELKARDEQLDRRLTTRDLTLDKRLDQMDEARDEQHRQLEKSIDQRFEMMTKDIDRMADRRGIPRPHRDD